MIWKDIHQLMVVSIGIGVKLLVLPYKSFIFILIVYFIIKQGNKNKCIDFKVF